MATPAARAPAPRPPDKGVFPLDHFNECKEARPQNESSRSNELVPLALSPCHDAGILYRASLTLLCGDALRRR